jgi:hypothetical protein
MKAIAKIQGLLSVTDAQSIVQEPQILFPLVFSNS